MSKVFLSRINLIILLISCITAACAQSFFNFGKNNNTSAPSTTAASNSSFPEPNPVMSPKEFQKTIADAQAAAQKKANQAMQPPNVPTPVTPRPSAPQPAITPPLQTAPVSSPVSMDPANKSRDDAPPPKPVQAQPGIQAPLPATSTPPQPVPNLPMSNPPSAQEQQQPQPYTGFGTTPPNTPKNTNNQQSGGWNIKY